MVMAFLLCVCVRDGTYRMCAENSDDLRQGHVPQFVSESSSHQPVCGMKDVILHNKKPGQRYNSLLSGM